MANDVSRLFIQYAQLPSSTIVGSIAIVKFRKPSIADFYQATGISHYHLKTLRYTNSEINPILLGQKALHSQARLLYFITVLFLNP
jgi:hypothetical protein